MSEDVSAVVDVSDAQLIAQVRAGDTQAYGQLFDRHRQAAQRLAASLVRSPDADDLVAEAFTRLLVLLQDGKGPDEAFRAYLLTAIRRLHVDRIRSTTRTRPTDDDTTFDRGIDFVDPATTSFENQAAASAFASLPERWQLVLWHLEVEGQKPADVAPLLGMTANGVSALAYRAREGLRQAYLQGHLAENVDADCRAITPLLGGYVRRGLSARDTAKVEAHLDTCRRCAGIYLELAEVNANLGALLAPALLGAAASAYLGGAGAAAAAGAAASGAAASGAAVSGGGTAAGGAAAGSAVTGGAATSGAVAGGAATGAAATGAAAVGGVTASGSALVGIGAVGSAGTVGSAAVVGTLAQTVVLPVKAAVAAVGVPTAVAGTVVAAGVATTAGVVAVRNDAPPPPPVVTAAPTTTTSPDAPAPQPTSTTPSETPADPPSQAPEPEPTDAPSEAPEPDTLPTDEASSTPDPTPTPTPTPTPVPPVSDYAAGTATITSELLPIGQRRVVVPFTVTASGDQPATTDVSVRVDFKRSVVFRGADGGWTCQPDVGQLTRILTCTASVPSGQPFSFTFKAIGILPQGSITLTTATDPDPSNNTSMFAAGLWLLTL